MRLGYPLTPLNTPKPPGPRKGWVVTMLPSLPASTHRECVPACMSFRHCNPESTESVPRFQVQPGPCRSLPVGARARLVSVFPSGPFLMLFGKCIPFHSPAPSLLISRPPFFLIFTFSWTPRTLLYIFSTTFPIPAGSVRQNAFFLVLPSI